MSKFAKIVSDDKRFARMLTIELESIGIEIVTSSDSLGEGDVLYVIADLDSVSETKLLEYSQNAILIGFSRSSENGIHESACLCEEFFKRPFSMRDFLSLFGGDRKSLTERGYTKKEASQNTAFLSVSDIDKAAVWGDQRIPLSDNEYKVLSLLCDNRYQLVERERIYALLGADEGNMGDVYICHLRKKIDNKLGLKLIYTIRGKGYMLKN